MAQLLLISAATKNDSNSLGDIVGVFEDNHVFSPAEIAGFDIHKVAGKLLGVQEELEALKPELAIDERYVGGSYECTVVDKKEADLKKAITFNSTVEKIPVGKISVGVVE